MAGCPYLACVKGKKEIPLCANAMSYVNRDPKKGPTNQKCCPGLYITKTRTNEFMCQRSKGGIECLKGADCPQPLCAEISAVCIKGKCGIPTCPLMMIVGPSPSNAVSSSGTVSPSGEPSSVCCLPDGSCSVATKQICNSMYGKMTDKKSCAPNKCKPFTSTAPPPVPDSYYNKCAIDGMKNYACSGKKTVNWSCECFNFSDQPAADYYYNCIAQMKDLCPPSVRYASLAITAINIRYQMWPGIQIFWDTNKPTTSYMEYGETTSYGSVFYGETPVGSPNIPDKQHFLGNAGLSVGLGEGAKLRPDTLYHFRIVATDAKGNTLTSDDYTFSTVRPYGSKHWIACQAGEVMQKTCVNGELVDRCTCTPDGAWACSGDIATSCSAPTPVKITSEKLLNNKFDAMPAPVAPTPAVQGECETGDEKQYDCSDKTQVFWCKCPATKKWDCAPSPEKLCIVSSTSTIPSTTDAGMTKKQ